MVRARKIKLNSLFTFLSQLIRLSTNVVLFIGIARTYGPERFGQFTAAHTMATIFLLLADFGFDILLSSEIAHGRTLLAELVGRYLSLKIVFALGASLAMGIVALYVDVSASTRILVYVFTFYVFFSSLTNFFFALFKGVEEMHHETKISFASNLFLLIAVLIAGVLHASLPTLAVLFVGSRLITVLLAFLVMRNRSPGQGIRFEFPKAHDIGLVTVFGLHSLFGNLFFLQDTILLSWWVGDRAVGVYQSVFKVVSFSLIALDIIFYSILPVLSRLYGEKVDQWRYLGHLVHKTLLYVALPISLAMVVFAEQIVSLLYGLATYAEAVVLFRIFGCIVFVRYLADASGTMLTSSNRQRVRLVIVTLAVVLNYSLNSVAIPKYGTEGAAMVSLVTNVFVGVGYITASRRESIAWLLDTSSIIPVVITVVVGMILWTLKSISFFVTGPIAILLITSASLYIGYTPAERALLFSFKESTVVNK